MPAVRKIKSGMFSNFALAIEKTTLTPIYKIDTPVQGVKLYSGTRKSRSMSDPSAMRKQLAAAISEAVSPQFEETNLRIESLAAEFSQSMGEMKANQSEMIGKLDSILAALNHQKL